MFRVAAVLLVPCALLGCASDGGGDRRYGRVAEVETDTATRTEAIRENLASFGSDSPLQRYRAIRSMLDLGRSADPYLIEALLDSNPRVRSTAKYAVLFQADPQMVQPLYGAFRQAHLSGLEEGRTSVLYALITQGRQAIPYLIRLIEEPERPVRVLGLFALLEILGTRPSAELPGPDDPQLASYWKDWWGRNEGAWRDPVELLEPLSYRSTEVTLALQERDFFRAALAQQQYRLLYWMNLNEPETKEIIDPWRDTVASLGKLRRDPKLKAMERDLVGVMIAMSFELTGRGEEALDVLNGITPGPEHGGGAPILQHMVELSRFWAHRRMGANPDAATALESAVAWLEAGAVPESVGLRRLYLVARRFFEEWSLVK